MPRCRTASLSISERSDRLSFHFARRWTDFTARYRRRLSAKLANPWSSISPCRAGVVGAEWRESPPDGHTLLVCRHIRDQAASIRAALQVKDFAPITLLISGAAGWIVHPSVPGEEVNELIAYAKANPGKLNYGSSGPGSIAHLSTELLDAMAGIRMTHIPYKGVAAYTAAQLGNEIQVGMSNLFSTTSHWKAGRLRLLAHSGAKRIDSMPELPTIAESGVPGYEATIWYGFMGPAKTPRPVVQALHREIVGIANTPDASQLFVSQAMTSWEHAREFAKVIRPKQTSGGIRERKLGVTLD